VLLLVTHREDLTADWLVWELESRGAAFIRFNTEDYPTRALLEWTTQDVTLELVSGSVRCAEVDAVWWRRPLEPHMPAEMPEAEARWAATEAAGALTAVWRSMDAHWVNAPTANADADCKPEQLVRAARCGLDVPATLLTNSAGALRRFLTRHPSAVCKSLRDPRVPQDGEDRLFFTSALALADVDDLGDLGPEPYLFQALVPKRYDIRVTVIGDRAWSCRIESQDVAASAVDWRRGPIEQLPHAVEELPPAIARRCVELAHSYGLRFAAIDLVRRDDGGYSFLELNPNGQWVWVERLTSLPLRARLADELLRVA
jgi:glutathione synthase/RimK-type ligase-like ATP-grasp enzyme